MVAHDRTVVIGLGNEFRSDDAVGLAVARRIRDARLASVEVAMGLADGTQLMELWEGATAAIIVDCVASEAAPGCIFRFEATGEAIPKSLFSTYSTHCIDVSSAIEMARTLGLLPSKVIVYGIQGARFDMGTDMTPEVRLSIEPVVRQILEDLNRR